MGWEDAIKSMFGLPGVVVGALLTFFIQARVSKFAQRYESTKLRLSKLEELLQTNYKIKELGFGIKLGDVEGISKRNSDLITRLSVNIILYHPELRHHMLVLTDDLLKFQKEMGTLSPASGEEHILEVFQRNIQAIFKHTDELTSNVETLAKRLIARIT